VNIIKFKLVMKSAIFLVFSSLVSALHVIQWQDNMILSENKYLDLSNSNIATKISERDPSLEQYFMFNLVSFPTVTNF
jgi:hypothetical protein